tara:strand:- start:145 stop:441 length:297 start_codon:yes stop_codon:yes gene_type:complete
MAEIQDRIGDLSWLGENFADQGWVQVEGEINAIAQATPSLLAWEKAKELLRQSDWTVLSDVPMNNETKNLWIEYRRQLRAMRNQIGFPDNITWPSRPE